MHGNQAGDPAKAGAAIIAAVESSEPPAFLLLGPDALTAFRHIAERARRKSLSGKSSPPAPASTPEGRHDCHLSCRVNRCGSTGGADCRCALLPRAGRYPADHRVASRSASRNQSSIGYFPELSSRLYPH